MAGTANEVDRLNARIQEIQENCCHNFQLQEPANLVESLVPGVYVGRTEGLTSVGRPDPQIQLVCVECSLSKRTCITVICPQCFGEMGRGYCLGAGSREKYFGQRHLYYAIIEQHCPQCGFIVASDEWDQ